MKFLMSYDEDRALAASEVIELIEVPIEPGARSVKVMARLRDGEIVRVDGSDLNEVTSKLASVQSYAGAPLWILRAHIDPAMSTPGQEFIRVDLQPVIAWRFGDGSWPVPVGPIGHDSLHDEKGVFLTDWRFAWTVAHPVTGAPWHGTFAEAVNTAVAELAAPRLEAMRLESKAKALEDAR